MYDIIVVGGGPAGLTAALYALRGGKSVLVIEKSVFGGQITNSPKVENIPGFAAISGDEFADLYLKQVMGQGGEVEFGEVTAVNVIDDENGRHFDVTTDMDDTFQSKACVLATGTVHRTLGLPGEEDLIGDGIHFCAVCDGDMYQDKTVCMIGGGNSAFVEANLLADVCRKVILLQDLPFFTADQKLQDQLFSRANVEKHAGTKVQAYEITDGKLTGVTYTENGVTCTAACQGVFLAVGLIPDNKAFTNVASTNNAGYFATDESCTTETAGLFVAGDCRAKSLRQVTTACADGAVAAIAACNYLR